MENLVSVKCYLIVILTCISLTTNDTEHLCICFLAISVSSLGKCLFKPLAHFLIGLFVLSFVELYNKGYLIPSLELIS